MGKRKFLKKVLERCLEGILTLSGGVTSLVILLIVIFLFGEGATLFRQPNVENGYALLVHPQNNVNNLSSKQIKDIFDEEVTQWTEVGGNHQDNIFPFRLSDLPNHVSIESLGSNFENAPRIIDSLILSRNDIIAFVPLSFVAPDGQARVLPEVPVSPRDFYLGDDWQPTAHPAAQFGVLPLVTGTLWVSLLAVLISLPFGLAVAIYLAEIADERVRKWFKPLIELLAGIPSVVYGFFGLTVIVPLIQRSFGLPVGETVLAGSIVLAIMALPTIITVAEDAMRTIPRTMKEASLALGATHWQTIYRVVIPCAVSGITAAVVLGIGRAVGETMAVLMVTGNAAVIPHSILEPVRTIPATIAAELGEAPKGGAHYEALFQLGGILFIITLVISITVEIISARKKYNLL